MSDQVKFDDTWTTITERFKNALIEVMRAECEMMEKYHPDCWSWGRCEIIDLAHINGIHFNFGANEDLPDDNLGQFAVIIKE
ncbi:hypothetical protein LCGC14_1651700 [marine sediment metagenome]|uniref:Uncharacterized protein n=1 Tax=marine sediment metagenome TaxID=412755 RepID=A0A0F9HXC8_9ZZZZ